MRFGSILPFNRLEKANYEGQLYILASLFLKKDSRNRVPNLLASDRTESGESHLWIHVFFAPLPGREAQL